MPRLIGDNIILREYRKADLPFINSFVNDYEITVNLSDIFLRNHPLESTEKYLNSIFHSSRDLIFIRLTIYPEIRFLKCFESTSRYLSNNSLFFSKSIVKTSGYLFINSFETFFINIVLTFPIYFQQNTFLSFEFKYLIK